MNLHRRGSHCWLQVAAVFATALLVFSHSAAQPGLSKDIKFILELSDDELRALVPARKPIKSWAKFPVPGFPRWHPDKPRHVTIGKETFIPEERFPPDKELQVTGPDGKVWTYEYFEDKTGEPIYPSSLTDKGARYFLVRAVTTLANRYTEHGDRACAHKAAVIIQRFAEIYPSYPIYGRISNRGKYMFHGAEPYPYTSAKWNEWYPVDLYEPATLADAYAAIRDSGVIGELSKALGRDVKQQVEKGFLGDICHLIIKYDSWHATSLSMRTHNLQPSKCYGLIAIGRVIGEPELVHYAVANLKEILDARFMIDGIFPESPAYHMGVASRLKACADKLRGYSDPAGYADKDTGERFDDFDPDKTFPALPRALDFIKQCNYPNGKRMVVHDTGYSHSQAIPPRDETSSRLFPAFGYGILGRGTDAGQMEAHLDFTKGFGHEHQDALNIIIWACGEELLPDIGYTYTYRGWATSSLAHNLVIVDGSSQPSTPLDGSSFVTSPEKAVGGQILSWSPVRNGFGVVEATATDAYPQCSIYDRTLMLVEVDEARAFVVDIFSVTGGSQHDWMAHGSCDHPQTLSFDKPAKPYADSLAADGVIHLPMPTVEQQSKGLGTEFDKYGDVSQYWGNIRHVSEVTGPGPWVGTFAGVEDAEASLRLHLLAPTDCHLYVGEAPSIRQTDEHLPDIEKYMTRIMTARRTSAGGEELSSRFVAVWEPYRTEPWITEARTVDSTDEGVVIAVKAGDDTFSVVWGTGADSSVSADGVEFTGRFACVRTNRHEEAMHFYEGTRLRCGGREIIAEPPPALQLLGAGTDERGDYMLTTGPPPKQAATGRWGILIHPEGTTRAIKLGDVKPAGGNTKIYCPEGLGLATADGGKTWQETCFPSRRFEGQMLLTVPVRVDMKLWAAGD